MALAVARALDAVGAPYFLGGSLASSVQGEPRATNDIDLVIELSPSRVRAFAQALGPDFEVDEEALAEAALRRSSWNIYHLPSMTKVDLFIRRPGAFDDSEFGRRRAIDVRPGQQLLLKSPEDTVLRKLLWFRDGGGVSTTQWRDLVEVLRVGGSTLDHEYLRTWSVRLSLEELLQRALGEAKL